MKPVVKITVLGGIIPAIFEQLILKFIPFFIPHLIFIAARVLVFEIKNLKVEKISTASDIMIFYSCSAVHGGTFKQLPMTLKH